MAVFVNKIDELIDTSLNRFFTEHVNNTKLFSAVGKEINFVKFQNKLHEVLDVFISSIDVADSLGVGMTTTNSTFILNIIKRYAAYYCYLWIAATFTGKKIEYINNVVEIGKASQRSMFTINNFYNSDNNSILFRLYDLIQESIYVLSIDNIKASPLATPAGIARYRTAIDFLNELGSEYVTQHLKTTGTIAINNLIKTIIIERLYQSDEKAAVVAMLQESEMESGEYTYIEIVVPRFEYVDYAEIEKIMTVQQLRSGIADVLYEELHKLIDQRITTIDDKIGALLNSGILIPIVEDFVLINKDTEHYERDLPITTDGKLGRSDDTRLRYIVTKLDAVSELYSANTKNNPQRREQIEKLLYAPLKTRRATLVNEIEDIKILNKIENQGKQSDNSEFYHDLQQYRLYPYVSFKALNAQGFSYRPSSTIQAVRSTNFEFAKELQSVPIELRSASDISNINIVGFMIRPLGNPTGCYRVDDIIDIRKFTMKSKQSGRVFKTDNGYLGAIRYIRSAIVKGRHSNPPVYWMFNTDKDKFDFKGYEPISAANMQEYLKLLVVHLYDRIEDMMVARIADDLRKLSDAGEIFSVTEVLKYIREAEHRTITLTNEARATIYAMAFSDFYPPGIDVYDDKEDLYPGFDTPLTTNLHYDPRDHLEIDADIPTVPVLVALDSESVLLDTETPATLTTVTAPMGDMVPTEDVPDMSDAQVASKIITYISQNVDYQHAICQHVLVWQDTMQLKRDRNIPDYEASLYEFIQTYVKDSGNEADDYVCKSCDEILPIKHFVVDGVYDDEQQKFLTFAIPMDTPLEDVREYEKYGKIIKNIDRRVDRICDMINLKFYSGSSTTAKWRRRTIVKTVLDIMLAHNQALKTTFKTRNETATKLYGIDRNLSTLFFFEIDDSIFDYSSRDRDFYRLVKLNNVTAYIICVIMLEVDAEQIINLGRDKRAKPDKLCNIEVYERGANVLFDKLKVLRNAQGGIEQLGQIPSFSYTLFIISCILTRNKVWFVDTATESTTKNFNTKIQRSIIHTTVDLINSILEIYVRPGDQSRSWIYNMIGGRFMNHMKTLYESPALERRLNDLTITDDSQSKLKKQFMMPKRAADTERVVPPTGHYRSTVVTTVTPDIQRRTQFANFTIARGQVQRLTPRTPQSTFDRYTNCPDGAFHTWVHRGDTFKCKHCEQMMSDVLAHGASESAHDEQVLLDNIWTTTLVHMSKTMCINGLKHDFDTNDNRCTVCHRTLDQPPSTSDLRKLKTIVTRTHTIKPIKTGFDTIDAAPARKRSTDVVQMVASLQSEDPTGVLLSTIETVIGKNTKLPGDQSLYDDTYIIEYNYLGNRLSKPIIINSREGKLIYRKTHPLFKTSILYYTDQQKQIDVYYDAITHAYLGFRERDRNFIATDTPHYLKIKWSLKTELEHLGFSGMNMRMSKLMIEFGISDADFNDGTVNYGMLINYVYRQRFDRIVQSIGEIQRIIYRIHHKFTPPSSTATTDDDGRHRDGYDTLDKSLNIVHEFSKTLSTMRIGNAHTVFDNWQTILVQLSADTNLTVGDQHPDVWISATDLEKDDVVGKRAINYLCMQLKHLLDNNTSKFIAVNVVNLIVKMVNYGFNMWNMDALEHDYALKQFLTILDMRHAYMISALDDDDALSSGIFGDTEVMVASDGVGVITDDISDDHITTNEEADEMFDITIDIDGGREMEEDGEFIGDYRDESLK